MYHNKNVYCEEYLSCYIIPIYMNMKRMWESAHSLVD
jgi:hypothetical protein